MSPVIRISKANWERLKHFAVPLQDSIDDALNRVLNIAESSGMQTSPYKPDAHQQSSHEIQSPAQARQWQIANENQLLLEFERWLDNIGPRVKLLHRKKTMATWELEREDGKKLKFFVPTNGSNKLYLPVVDYAPVDKQAKIAHKNYYDAKTGRIVGWNYYPQFNVKTAEDLNFVRGLVEFVLKGRNE
jgi:hypothetical protein